jgi:hypothetical protein
MASMDDLRPHFVALQGSNWWQLNTRV